jgi:hypothetical protein
MRFRSTASTSNPALHRARSRVSEVYTASVMVRWLAGDQHLVVGWASTIIVASFRPA